MTQDVNAEKDSRVDTAHIPFKRDSKFLVSKVDTSSDLKNSIRQAVNLIGGFDENYGMGTNDDHDFCIRTRMAGYSIICVLDTFVFHFYSRTLQTTGSQNLDKKNRAYLVSKFGRTGLEYFEAIDQPYMYKTPCPFSADDL